jgi:hypothetical protein
VQVSESKPAFPWILHDHVGKTTLCRYCFGYRDDPRHLTPRVTQFCQFMVTPELRCEMARGHHGKCSIVTLGTALKERVRV